MDNRDLLTAVDLVIENVLHRHYPTQAEQDEAMRQAMHELDLGA